MMKKNIIMNHRRIYSTKLKVVIISKLEIKQSWQKKSSKKIKGGNNWSWIDKYRD